MAAPLMRIDASASSAIPLCRDCSWWRGAVHTGPQARSKAAAEFEAHRRAHHAAAAHDTRNKRRRALVVNT